MYVWENECRGRERVKKKPYHSKQKFVMLKGDFKGHANFSERNGWYMILQNQQGTTIGQLTTKRKASFSLSFGPGLGPGCPGMKREV